MTEATTVLPPPASDNSVPLATPLVNPSMQNLDRGVREVANPSLDSLDRNAQEVGNPNERPDRSARETGSTNTHQLDQSAQENERTRAHLDQSARSIEGIPDEEMLYDLADLFKVFSDTTRIKILYVLMERDQCVADIAEAIGATQSAVSHQLRILKQAHLVKFQRHGKSIRYSLADDHVYTVLAQGMSHICE